ncbi:MAG TPA: hypothetical protein VFH51_17140 [Myxococcota bacterium]|nr:hypothetical protein [Myxococcota bacterium]
MSVGTVNKRPAITEDATSKKEHGQLRKLSKIEKEATAAASMVGGEKAAASHEKAKKELDKLLDKLEHDGLNKKYTKMAESAVDTLKDIIGKPGHGKEFEKAMDDLAEAIVIG